jgi:signal transduction histidine kinase
VVEDDGEGIDAGDLPLVFDPFSRGENARSRHVPGTGLGLHIVKTIVEAHGGEVSVQSRVGVGSTFRLTLPR